MTRSLHQASQSQQQSQQQSNGAPPSPRVAVAFDGYRPIPGAQDELFDAEGTPHAETESVVRLIDALGPKGLDARQAVADSAFRDGGVTFSVYADERGSEKVMPFDLIPRPIGATEWERVDRGLTQRVKALNLFLGDVYGPQRILKDKKIPEELVLGSQGFLKEMMGVKPLKDVFTHISGIDLIRDAAGEFVVLEDNVRTPSGVSYVLENRSVMKRIYPRIFHQVRPRSVSEYPVRLREALTSVSPVAAAETRLVVLTPGTLNSAYFEHSFLARSMGCDLVQGQDLFVDDDKVYVKTTKGPARVHVIYRRIDDDFLDPEVFKPESVIGVPGLFRAYVKGNVAIANGVGNGIADDKAIYPYVHDMIRYYLDEEPVIAQVETYLCHRPTELAHVLANLATLVVKAVDASGGYGMLFGPRASKAEIADFAEQVKANPRGYIAQPIVELSTCPTSTPGGLKPRRVDLRPFVLTGTSSWVLPGGLTRVALVEGSYVVNSSQGGGSKDTWVLQGDTQDNNQHKGGDT